MNQRLSIFIFISILISACSSSIEENEPSDAKEVIEEPEDSLFVKYTDLSAIYYPDYNYKGMVTHYKSGNYGSIYYQVDTIESVSNGPVVQFDKNGIPAIVGEFYHGEYTGWEHYFDSTGVLVEEREFGIDKDERFPMYYKDYNREGEMTGCYYFEVDHYSDSIVFKENETYEINIQWESTKKDSLVIRYMVWDHMKEMIHLGKIGSNDTKITIPKLWKGENEVLFHVFGFNNEVDTLWQYGNRSILVYVE